jgi:hypothetical protein
MKKYKCHKSVEAGRISMLSAYGVEVMTDGQREHVTWTRQEADRINHAVMSHNGGGLGYLVRYEDGYLSWAPTAVFEAGYTELFTTERPVDQRVGD